MSVPFVVPQMANICGHDIGSITLCFLFFNWDRHLFSLWCENMVSLELHWAGTHRTSGDQSCIPQAFPGLGPWGPGSACPGPHWGFSGHQRGPRAGIVNQLTGACLCNTASCCLLSHRINGQDNRQCVFCLMKQVSCAGTHPSTTADSLHLAMAIYTLK